MLTLPVSAATCTNSIIIIIIVMIIANRNAKIFFIQSSRFPFEVQQKPSVVDRDPYASEDLKHFERCPLLS